MHCSFSKKIFPVFHWVILSPPLSLFDSQYSIYISCPQLNQTLLQDKNPPRLSINASLNLGFWRKLVIPVIIYARWHGEQQTQNKGKKKDKFTGKSKNQLNHDTKRPLALWSLLWKLWTPKRAWIAWRPAVPCCTHIKKRAMKVSCFNYRRRIVSPLINNHLGCRRWCIAIQIKLSVAFGNRVDFTLPVWHTVLRGLDWTGLDK